MPNSERLPDGYKSKAIRLVAKEQDFKNLELLKTNERAQYLLKHAQVLPRPKKKAKKRFRVYLDMTEEQLKTLEVSAAKAGLKKAELAMSALDFYLSLAGQDFQKALSESEGKL